MTTPPTYANHLAIHRALDLAPVLQGRGLGALDLMVLVVIARHLGHDGQPCWLAYETIAQEALCSRDTAIRSVRKLAGAGVLLVGSKGKGRTNLYTFLSTPNQLLPATTQSLTATSGSQQPVADSNSTSSSQLLQPVAHSHYPVADSNSTSSCQQPEVIPEEDQKVSKGKRSLTSSDGGRADGSGTSPSDPESAATAKARATDIGTESVDSPENGINGSAPAAPPAAARVSSPAASRGPEHALADHYFALLEHPRAHQGKLAAVWPAAFRKLLTDYSPAELKGAATWAFGNDFWSEKMFRRIGDPVDYFVEKADTIIPQYQEEQRKARSAATRNTAPADRPVPVNPISKYIKYI